MWLGLGHEDIVWVKVSLEIFHVISYLSHYLHSTLVHVHTMYVYGRTYVWNWNQQVICRHWVLVSPCICCERMRMTSGLDWWELKCGLVLVNCDCDCRELFFPSLPKAWGFWMEGKELPPLNSTRKEKKTLEHVPPTRILFPFNKTPNCILTTNYKVNTCHGIIILTLLFLIHTYLIYGLLLSLG